MKARQNLASDLFDAYMKFSNLNEELTDFITQEVFGLAEDDFDWPFGDITHDYYDSSFELKGCKEGLELTDEQRLKCGAVGFWQCWLCFKDGSEKFYSFRKKEDGSWQVRL